MNKKIFWVIFCCLLIAVIISIISYYLLDRNLLTSIVIAILVVVLMFFVIFSILFDYFKRKRWMGFGIALGLVAIFFTFIIFEIHTVFQVDKKQKEIDAISLIIEQEEDEDERWRLIIEEKMFLLDERITLSQRGMLYNIGALVAISLISILNIFYREKENDIKQ